MRFLEKRCKKLPVGSTPSSSEYTSDKKSSQSDLKYLNLSLLVVDTSVAGINDRRTVTHGTSGVREQTCPTMTP